MALSKTEHRPKEEQKPPDSPQGWQKHTGEKASSLTSSGYKAG